MNNTSKIIIDGNLYKNKYEDFKRKYEEYSNDVMYSHVLYGTINNYTIGKSIKNTKGFTLNIHFNCLTEEYNNRIGIQDIYIEVETYSNKEILTASEIIKYLQDRFLALKQTDSKGTLWCLTIGKITLYNCKLDFAVTVNTHCSEEVTYRPVIIDCEENE